MSDTNSNGTDRSDWYIGPTDPERLEPYFRWLIDEFQGSLVEDLEGDSYHVEVTKLEERADGKFRPVEGRNAREVGAGKERGSDE